MKHSTRLLALILLLVLALLPGQPAYARGLNDGKVVIGDTYTVKSGETLSGDLVVIGGVATVEDGGTVTGNLVVVGGSMTIDGAVDGDAVLVGGAVSLGAKAVVGGDLVTVMGTLHRADGSRVAGQIVTATGPVFGQGPTIVAPTVQVPSVSTGSPFEMLYAGLRLAGFSVLSGIIALLIGLFLPDQLKRTGQATVGQPAVAGGLGCLTMILSPALIFLLAISILLLPVAAVAAILFGIAIIYGWMVLGFEIGDRLLQLFHAEWPVALVAGTGTLLLTLVFGALNYVPCVGPMTILILLTFAVGGVLMTRFGTRTVLPPVPMPPAPPAAPAPPQP